MQTTSRQLGDTFRRGEQQWRVVRVTHQFALCESVEGLTTVIEENLLELKSELGEIDFEVLTSEVTPYSGPLSTIKAPEPVNWRKE